MLTEANCYKVSVNLCYVKTFEITGKIQGVEKVIEKFYEGKLDISFTTSNARCTRMAKMGLRCNAIVLPKP